MTWWMYALIGALVWGIHYNLIAKSMTVIQPISAYFLPNVILFITLPLWYKVLVEDTKAVFASSWDIKVTMFFLMFTSIIGTVAVYKAIHSSNATLASLLEMSYPVFVALCAYFIFQQNHVTWSVAIGGALILAGSATIIYSQG